MTSRPAFSIVMPALNAARTIAEAIASVAETRADWEMIVVDGGSTDETAALVARCDRARLISAPGTTIYQALNVALAEARAPHIAWLNADDLLLPGALDRVGAAFAADREAEIVRGRARFMFSDGAAWRDHAGEIERRVAGPLRLDLVTRGPLAINAMFFRRSLIERVGRFDETLRLAADREWMLRAWLAGVRVREIADPVYRYRIHAGSSTLDPGRRNDGTVRGEHAAILRRYLPDALGRRRDDPVRLELRRWNAVECALRLNGLVRARRLRAAADLIGTETRIDPAWPLVAAVIAGRRTAARLWRREISSDSADMVLDME
jgi:glycosyltransferase involved in cell wall biosynthesis